MPHVTLLWLRALSMDHMKAHYADPRSHTIDFAVALPLRVYIMYVMCKEPLGSTCCHLPYLLARTRIATPPRVTLPNVATGHGGPIGPGGLSLRHLQHIHKWQRHIRSDARAKNPSWIRSGEAALWEAVCILWTDHETMDSCLRWSSMYTT